MTSDQPSTHVVAVLLDVAPDGTAAVISRGFMNARYRDGLETGVDLEPGTPATLPLELIDKDHRVAADHEVELILASSSSTWVLSDERRATNTFDLASSTLELPVDGPAPAGPPPVGQVVAPAPSPSPPAPAAPAACARRAVLRLPRGARRVRVLVNGRRTRARVRGRKVTVTLPRTRTGRVVVRATFRAGSRRQAVVRRVRGCRI
jgi:hypothetical protein